ncbi:MAG: TonB-dependent receptor plug domain-containing protein [Bacteroidales bacterium]
MNRKNLNRLSGALMLCIGLLLCSTRATTLTAQTTGPNQLPDIIDAKLLAQESPDSLHLNLEQIVFQASFIKDKQSPLRLTTVDRKKIEKRAIGFTYPELIKDIPGVYATSETGSYGDAKINIRGFKQENISVLLNGIPISGLVTGNMFWNNWLGLSDATHSIQVQKGIGASMLSDNSVGGTINIITKGAQAKAGANVGFYATDYGQFKTNLSVNSGQNKKGWAFSAMGSYAWGSGYPNATNVNSWAYLVNISKVINSRHSLLFTALGSPERHQQRASRLTNAQVEQYGLKYNKNWGYHNGKKRSLSENFYHKPYLTLHHFFKINNRTELSNAIYLSVGHGGGKWSESKGPLIISYRKNGLIDWDAVEQENREIANGNSTTQTAAGSATNIATDFLAGHTQTGFKSNLSYKAGKNWTLQGGLHYQYYSTWEKEQITDLLGANYWYEDYENKSLAGLAGRNPIKTLGDFVRTYNGKIINHLTLYTSAQYKSEKWDIRLGASAMGTANRRWDRYNYTQDVYSELATGTGYSFKAGANHKFNSATSIYANAAIYSRVPYNNLFFSSGNNNITDNVKNESNILTEIGFRHLFQRGSIEITGYYAWWKNKSIMSNPYKQPDETNLRYLIRGLDALHKGVEITGNYNPSHFLSLAAYLSFGDWRWQNNVSANIYDPYSGLVTKVINVYSHGLPVGDAPQTQLALSAEANLTREITIMADWSNNSRMYADFDPKERQDANDTQHSFKLPGYSLVNMGISWEPTLMLNSKKVNINVYARINNLFNEKYIERGKDGANHNLATFSGFWGVGRNASAGVRFSF